MSASDTQVQSVTDADACEERPSLRESLRPRRTLGLYESPCVAHTGAWCIQCRRLHDRQVLQPQSPDRVPVMPRMPPTSPARLLPAGPAAYGSGCVGQTSSYDV